MLKLAWISFWGVQTTFHGPKYAEFLPNFTPLSPVFSKLGIPLPLPPALLMSLTPSFFERPLQTWMPFSSQARRQLFGLLLGFLKFACFKDVFVFICMRVSACTWVPLEAKREVLDTQKLDLQDVNHLIWVMRTDLGPL